MNLMMLAGVILAVWTMVNLGRELEVVKWQWFFQTLHVSLSYSEAPLPNCAAAATLSISAWQGLSYVAVLIRYVLYLLLYQHEKKDSSTSCSQRLRNRPVCSLCMYSVLVAVTVVCRSGMDSFARFLL